MGLDDGATLGDALRVELRREEGSDDGLAVGDEEGSDDGATLGAKDGETEGIIVGDILGAWLGEYAKAKEKEANAVSLTQDDLRTICRKERSDGDPLTLSKLKGDALRVLYDTIVARRLATVNAAESPLGILAAAAVTVATAAPNDLEEAAVATDAEADDEEDE